MYMHLLQGFHNSLEIEQRGDNMILELSFFQVCLHLGLHFSQRGGKFKWLIILLLIDSPTKNLYKCNLNDIYNQCRNLVSLISSGPVFFTGDCNIPY